MNREIVSGQKMKPRIGPLAKLDFFYAEKVQCVYFQLSPYQFKGWADMGISSPVRLP